MDSDSGASRELQEILRLAKAEWAGRSWRTCKLGPDADEKALRTEGPAFAYFWEADASPVEVAFVSGGAVTARSSRTMLIEFGHDFLRVQIPGRRPLAFDRLDPGVSERMAGLIPEVATDSERRSRSARDELDEISAAMRMIVLAGRIVRTTADRGEDPGDPAECVERMHQWFQTGSGTSPALADAADHLGRSPRQLIRLLKHCTGAGFSEHLNLHRMIVARMLVMTSGRSIIDIARECGFKSREPFIRSFTKAFGSTPLQFRKAWREASLSDEEHPELCRMSGRTEVTWLPPGSRETAPGKCGTGTVRTLVIANPLKEIVELFELGEHQQLTRRGLLDRGRMLLIARSPVGRRWHVRAAESGRSGWFVTPEGHAGAITGGSRLSAE